MRIGLTGGVGCGATEVARMLQARGAKFVSADEIGHKALKDPQVKDLLAQRFGRGILDAKGEVDRRRLGEIVFSDEDARRDLNRIIHPALLDMLKREVKAAEAESGIVVVDAALIFEWGLEKFFHKVIVVNAPLEMRIQRTMQRDGLTRDQVMQIIAAQLPMEKKLKSADIVISNEGTLEELHRRVDEVWMEIEG